MMPNIQRRRVKEREGKKKHTHRHCKCLTQTDTAFGYVRTHTKGNKNDMAYGNCSCIPKTQHPF